MKLLFSILLLCLSAVPHAALAQAKIIPGTHEKLQPFLGKEVMPETPAAYANLFYKKCVGENEDPKLDEYVETQCGCTSSRMPAALTLEEMQKLFDPANKDDYFYTRLITLAYVPCLEDSVHDFVYDNCLLAPSLENVSKGKKADVCQCIGDYMANEALQNPELQMPGFKGHGFNLSKAVYNPFPYVINSENFRLQSQYPTKSCVQKKVNGWE